jgi:hypothetical protein
MKKCIVGYGKYDSNSPTPEGFSFCARHELLGMRRKGRDGRWYEVCFHQEEGNVWVLLDQSQAQLENT